MRWISRISTLASWRTAPRHIFSMHLSKGSSRKCFRLPRSSLWLAKLLRSDVKLLIHPIVPPGLMVQCCTGHDAGLAIEPGFSYNNGIAASNKLFTYLVAGLPVILTDTGGQRAIARDLRDASIVY